MITHALLSHRVEHGRRLMTALCGVQLIEPAHTRLQACTVWPGEVECIDCKRAAKQRTEDARGGVVA